MKQWVNDALTHTSSRECDEEVLSRHLEAVSREVCLLSIKLLLPSMRVQQLNLVTRAYENDVAL